MTLSCGSFLFWERALERQNHWACCSCGRDHALSLSVPPFSTLSSFQICLHRKQFLCHLKEVAHAGVCCYGFFSFKGLSMFSCFGRKDFYPVEHLCRTVWFRSFYLTESQGGSGWKGPQLVIQSNLPAQEWLSQST